MVNLPNPWGRSGEPVPQRSTGEENMDVIFSGLGASAGLGLGFIATFILNIMKIISFILN
jgi:hypothetical protein